MEVVSDFKGKEEPQEDELHLSSAKGPCPASQPCVQGAEQTQQAPPRPEPSAEAARASAAV